MLAYWKAILVLGLGIASQVQCQLPRASHNETCGDGIRCDSKKSLSCQDQICRCVKPEEMIFDQERGICVVLAGERCSYTAVEILKEEKRWTEKLECVQNATCNDDGYCDCDKASSFENSGGTCSPKLGQGGNCTRDSECLTNVCGDSGLCSCNSTQAVFDPSRGKCVGLAGTLCGNYQYDCVGNTYCENRRYHLSNGYVGQERCRCHNNYLKSEGGLCLGTYNQACDALQMAPCSNNYACIDGRCMCPYPSYQSTQNEYSNTPCASLVGGPCLEKVDDNGNTKLREFPCVGNATCIRNPHGISECQCKDGFIESFDSQCRLEHGRPCRLTSECDTTISLTCRDGKCSCSGFEIYDKKKARCRGLAGAQCTKVNVANAVRGLNYCVDGAFCEDFRGLAIGKWACRCRANFVPNAERKCEPSMTAKPGSGGGDNDTKDVGLSVADGVTADILQEDTSSVEEDST